MAITRPALTYCHEEGVRDGTSLRESFSMNANTSARKFRVKFEERYTAITRFCGYSRILRNGSNEPVSLERLTPLNGQFTGRQLMYAVGADLSSHHKQAGTTQGDTDATKIQLYQQSHLEIRYERVPYKVKEDLEVSGTGEYDRFVSFDQLRPSADYLSLPNGCLKYVDPASAGVTGGVDGKTIPYNIGKGLPVLEMKATWHRLPYDLFDPTNPEFWFKRIFGDPANDKRPYLGCVNSEAFLGYERGTILFSAMEMNRKTSPLLDLEWEIVFTFAYDPNKWNFKYYFSTSTGPDNGWFFVAKDTSIPPSSPFPDDHTIYNERNLYNLFKVGAAT